MNLTRWTAVANIRLRLICVLTLGAYLLANTHLGAAVAVRIARFASTTSTVAETSHRPGCKCRNCNSNAAHGEHAKANTPAKDTQRPDCPSDREGCPCPGGCALCSAAKVPYHSSLELDLHPNVGLDMCRTVEPSDYFSPIASSLDRPPRA